MVQSGLMRWRLKKTEIFNNLQGFLRVGVASLEEHEPPYEEFYRVPSKTAALVNET